MWTSTWVETPPIYRWIDEIDNTLWERDIGSHSPKNRVVIHKLFPKFFRILISNIDCYTQRLAIVQSVPQSSSIRGWTQCLVCIFWQSNHICETMQDGTLAHTHHIHTEAQRTCMHLVSTLDIKFYVMHKRSINEVDVKCDLVATFQRKNVGLLDVALCLHLHLNATCASCTSTICCLCGRSRLGPCEHEQHCTRERYPSLKRQV